MMYKLYIINRYLKLREVGNYRYKTRRYALSREYSKAKYYF